MSITPLNIGSAANDGTGQDLRSGGQVINANFAELDQRTTAAQATAEAKVDKEIGKGLSTEDFTTGEKAKLAGLQPAHYRGTFTTLAALQVGVADPIAGDYGDVDAGVGADVQRYIWDVTDVHWVLQGASGGGPDNTDSLPEGTTNLYFTGARVRSVVLSGLSLVSGAAIAAADSVLVAFGKLQKQITDLTATVGNKAAKGVNSDITQLSALSGAGYTALRDGLPALSGATSSSAGTKGLVPAPPILGASPKFLADDGTFKEAGGGSGDNVGDIKPWKYSRATIPGGRLPHDGQIVTNGRTLYPEFWALIQPFCVTDAVWLAAPYDKRGLPSLGNGTTDFRMPDDNAKHADGNTIAAMVLRGDGKNSAGTPGWHQADQLQNITAAIDNVLVRPGGASGALARTDGSAFNWIGSASSLFQSAITFDASRVARAGTETRGSSTTVIWTSVVAKTAINSGTVDVTALSNTVNANSVAITANTSAIAGKQGKPFVSSPQVITAAGSLTITHGLPSVSNVRYVLVCVTAEAGYTAGQRISDTGWQSQVTTAAYRGVSFSWSGSGDVSLRFGSLPSVFAALHATTGVYTSLTNANWNIEVSVYP